jgi:DNA polymerase-3 subunit delta
VKDAVAGGKPLPMALREGRVWGVKERLFERVVPLLTDRALAQLLEAAQVCDGLVKGLKHPDWPQDPWDGLKRLLLMLVEQTSAAPAAGRGRVVVQRLALQA